MKNKIQCLECKKYFKEVTNSHLKKCSGITLKQYKEKYPDIILVSEESNKKRGEGNRGKKHSAESNRKRSETLKGRVFTDDHKKKIGDGNRGKDMSGENNPMFGKTHSLESRKKQSIAQKELYKNGYISPNKGRKFSQESCKKMSKAKKGIKLSDDHCENLRISTIKRIENQKGQIFPNYSKNGCNFFDYLNKTFNLKGLHAENGGEYHIKQLGYFVDFYEPDLNLVIEYDGKNHKYQKEKDLKRQQKIEKYLGCKFIRIRENNFNW